MSTESKYIISEFYDFKPENIKKIIKEAEEKNIPVTLKGILQKGNALNKNGRRYPLEILKREANKYNELVKERRALGECVPAGTQIFTESGWKNIEEVKVGDLIYTLNIESNKLEIQSVENTIKKNYNDDMIHIYNNNNLDMMITKKHKVVLWNRNNKPYILTGEELFEKLNNNDSVVNHSHIKHSGIWEGEYSEYFQIPNSNYKIKSEDWAAFLGIFISEGHCSGTKGGEVRNDVGITQTKEKSKKQIKELLDRLPFQYTIRNNRQFIINDEKLHAHLFVLGNSHEKHIPDYAKNWSPELLNILFTWLLIGDGKNRSNNGILMKEYFTVSDKLSEDVYEIILKLGYGASISKIIPEDRFIYDEKEIIKEIDNGDGTIELVKEKIKIQRLIKAENSKELKLIHSRTSKGIYLDSRFVKAEKVSFNDNVYCVSIPNKTWLMKYNGKACWTHNCDHPDSAVVSLSNVSHLVTKIWWEGETLYGEVEILDTPSGNILKGLLRSGVMLGISSRGVGSVKSQSGEDVVQEDFELIAFDFVSSPSTPGAYMFKEGVEKVGLKRITDNSFKTLRAEDTESSVKNKKLIDVAGQKFWTK